MTEEDVFLMNGIKRKSLEVISMTYEKRMKQMETAEKLDISERRDKEDSEKKATKDLFIS